MDIEQLEQLRDDNYKALRAALVFFPCAKREFCGIVEQFKNTKSETELKDITQKAYTAVRLLPIQPEEMAIFMDLFSALNYLESQRLILINQPTQKSLRIH